MLHLCICETAAWQVKANPIALGTIIVQVLVSLIFLFNSLKLHNAL